MSYESVDRLERVRAALEARRTCDTAIAALESHNYGFLEQVASLEEVPCAVRDPLLVELYTAYTTVQGCLGVALRELKSVRDQYSARRNELTASAAEDAKALLLERNLLSKDGWLTDALEPRPVWFESVEFDTDEPGIVALVNARRMRKDGTPGLMATLTRIDLSEEQG